MPPEIWKKRHQEKLASAVLCAPSSLICKDSSFRKANKWFLWSSLLALLAAAALSQSSANAAAPKRLDQCSSANAAPLDLHFALKISLRPSS